MGGSAGNADPNYDFAFNKKIFDYPYIVDTELYLLPLRGARRRLVDAY